MPNVKLKDTILDSIIEQRTRVTDTAQNLTNANETELDTSPESKITEGLREAQGGR